MAVGLRYFYKPIQINGHGDWSLDVLVGHIDENRLNMDPVYQRGHVWTDKQSSEFVGFLAEGGRGPEVFVRELDYGQRPYLEVVDGKQRMTALHKWWKNEIPAILSGGRRIWKNEFSEVELRRIKRILNTSVQFIQGTDVEIMRVYLRLNRGGTVHSSEELRHVEELIGKCTSQTQK